MKKNTFIGVLSTLIMATLILTSACSFQSSEEEYERLEIDNNGAEDMSEKLYLIGIARWLDNVEFDKNIDGFKEGLKKFGLVEGENVKFIIKSPQGDKEKQEDIIDEFIEEEVDLIYSLTTPGTLIVKEKTSHIPIVFSIVTYPVETGLIDSLTSSNNNLVGTRNWLHLSKQLELIRIIDSTIKTIGFIHREGEPNSTIQYNDMIEEAALYGIEVININPSKLEELEDKLLAKIDGLDAIYLANDTLVQDGEEKIIELANQRKIITLSGSKSGVVKGALIADTTDFYNIGILSGQKASSILLQDKKPSDLVTESQRGSFVIVNLKTAEILDLEIPSEILSRAKLVID